VLFRSIKKEIKDEETDGMTIFNNAIKYIKANL
jgi:hypothetical protein